MKKIRIYKSYKDKEKHIDIYEEKDFDLLLKNGKKIFCIEKTRNKKESFQISKISINENNEYDKESYKFKKEIGNYKYEIKLDNLHYYFFEIGLFIDIYNKIFKKLNNKLLDRNELINIINNNREILKTEASYTKKERRTYEEYGNKELLDAFKIKDSKSRYYILEQLIIADNINYFYENKLKYDEIFDFLYDFKENTKLKREETLSYLISIERGKIAEKKLAKTKLKLQNIELKLKKTENKLKNRVSKLEDMELQLQDTESKLEDAKSELNLYAYLMYILKLELTNTDENYVSKLTFNELQNSIENINTLINASNKLNYINYEIIEKYIYCMYHLFLKEESNNFLDKIDLEKNIIYYDMHFYYFIFIIFNLEKKNNIMKDEYKKLIDIYFDRYSKIKICKS